jgi:hypothetical protein
MKTFSKLCAGVAVMAISLNAQAYPGESVVRDPATGNYTITYVGDPNKSELSQTIFVPSSKIDPAIRSAYRLGERNIILYRYTVSNGATAKQSIVGVVLEQIVNPILGEPTFPTDPITRAAIDAYAVTEKAALASPVGWDGHINRRIPNVNWLPKAAMLATGGIHAGSTLSGFGFNSLDLPGMGPSRMIGLVNETGGVFGFPDDGPVTDSAIIAELKQLRKNNFIVRNAAVPMIAVPSPFDAAVLLDRIRAQVATWPGKQLLDPAFAAQLDRYMVAAANAYRSNQPKAGKENIDSVRKLLEHEHRFLDHDDEDNDDTPEHKAATRLTIDRLAARVLDFDLRYVLKRMEHEHEHEHEHDEGDHRKER